MATVEGSIVTRFQQEGRQEDRLFAHPLDDALFVGPKPERDENGRFKSRSFREALQARKEAAGAVWRQMTVSERASWIAMMGFRAALIALPAGFVAAAHAVAGLDTIFSGAGGTSGQVSVTCEPGSKPLVTVDPAAHTVTSECVTPGGENTPVLGVSGPGYLLPDASSPGETTVVDVRLPYGGGYSGVGLDLTPMEEGVLGGLPKKVVATYTPFE